MVYITRDRRERLDGAFEKEVRWILNHSFSSPHFFAIAETAKYKPSESYDTWQQMKGERDEIVEIYYKNDWICDVLSSMTKDQMVRKIWSVIQLKIEEKKKKEREQNAHTNSTTSQ